MPRLYAYTIADVADVPRVYQFCYRFDRCLLLSDSAETARKAIAN